MNKSYIYIAGYWIRQVYIWFIDYTDIYYHEYGNSVEYLYKLPPKTMKSKSKTILGHNTNEFE